jgi:hypothetical protein
VSLGSTHLSTRADVSKFGSFSSFYEPTSQSELSILMALPKDRPDVYACALEIRKFVASLPLPGKARIRTEWIKLVVEGPEQYRPRLLQLIAQEIRATREALTNKAAVSISGLQQPVAIRRADESSVEIYLPYTITISYEN